ncbi:MAG: CPBP family intramembrane metalloprotease [Bacteroidetes bacterium]|nr:CPBP family intramembrane metalloprotease [Bacteroidota bacterium]
MRYPFPDNKPLRAIVVAATIVASMLVSLSLAFLIVKVTLPGLFGVADPVAFMASQPAQIAYPQATLYMQVITSSVGLFLIPSLMFLMLFRADMADRLRLSLPAAKYWLVAILTMISAGIFIQLLVQLMQLIPLPPVLQSMRAAGETIDKMLNAFFAGTTPGYFVALTLAMALMPAIAEEAFFRGTLQNTLRDFGITPIGAIVISGFTFAVIHMEFDNTLGIWCMGVVLGLLYYYTDSLWVCITAHFLNNFMIVAFKYYHMTGVIRQDLVSTDALPPYYTIPAGLVMVAGLVILSRWSGRKLTAPRFDYI